MDTDNIVQSLSQFTSCDVADALVKLNVPRGGFLPGLTLWSPERQQGSTKIVGPAYTVRYEYLSNRSSNSAKGAAHFVDTAPEGSIILISCPPDMLNACWGGLTTRRSQIRQVVGTVVDGRIRDLEELRELGYPVFAREVGITPPSEVAYVDKINHPVSIQQNGHSFIINPGDILIGDLNGVVCLPMNVAQEALKLMHSLAKAESDMERAIINGMSFTEASKYRA